MEKVLGRSATTDGLTVSPGLDLLAEGEAAPAQHALVDRRVLYLCFLAVLLGALATGVAQVFVSLIAGITNLAFFGRLSLAEVAPSHAVPALGLWVIPIPVVGGILVGLMARYGSKAIRGHGIPEAMEQILTNQSRIPPLITFLKPASSAVAIGSGGPFGAEGPIIATGGAIGSVFGQLLHTTTAERKTLLAAGAAAGTTAIFGTPVAAVLLAIELMLFEYRPRSIIPVALASASANAFRIMVVGSEPVFAMPDLAAPSGGALGAYVLLGAALGLAAVVVTKVVYWIEDAFEKLPVHWMWWPAIGGLAVGIFGYIAPDTLGVGYYNIRDLLASKLTITAAILLGAAKFASWSIALGSGTSGGTLAPLLTIGGAIGAALGMGIQAAVPGLGVDPRMAALVGMAAMFSGAARAMLASAVFVFEATMQPAGLLPLLGACAAAYLAAGLVMRNSIMTEKISRRGVRAPGEYLADVLDQVLVGEVASRSVVTINADDSVAAVQAWLESGRAETSHQGFPVVDGAGRLVGVLTRRDVLDPQASKATSVRNLLKSMPRYVYDDCTVRQAADHMVNHGIGRLPVVERGPSKQVVGILTRSDVLSAFLRRVRDGERQKPTLRIRLPWAGDKSQKNASTKGNPNVQERSGSAKAGDEVRPSAKEASAEQVAASEAAASTASARSIVAGRS